MRLRNVFGNKTRNQRYRLLLNAASSHTLTVSNDGLSRGYEPTWASPGAFSPLATNGRDLYNFWVLSTGNVFIVTFDAAHPNGLQIVDGVTQIEVTIEGAADNPYTLTWSTSPRTGAYELANQSTLRSYLGGQIGNDLAVTIKAL